MIRKAIQPYECAREIPQHLLSPVAAIFLILVLLSGCKDNSTGSGAGPDPDPDGKGALKVVTATEGNSPGYVLRLNEEMEHALPANDTLRIGELDEGSYEVEIGSVSHHCELETPAQLQVEIKAGETTTVTFEVSCQTAFQHRILFTRGMPFSSNDIYSMNPDGSEIERLTQSDQWYKEDLKVSPDGSRILFSAVPHDGSTPPSSDKSREIFVMNTDGAGIANLTDDPGRDDTDPSWSPDGTGILFAGNGNVYRMNVDGSGVTQLSDDPDRTDSNPVWAPDGSRILFHGREETSDGLFLMNSDGSGTVKLMDDAGASYSNASWSPDGSKILFRGSGLSGASGEGSHIYMMNVDGSGLTNLTAGHEGDFYGFSSPVWSPDGNRIAFTGRVEDPEDSDDYFQELFLIRLDDGSGIERLTRSRRSELSFPAWNDDPAWSPHGEKIAFTRTRHASPPDVIHVFIINADGTGETNISLTEGTDASHPLWIGK